MSDTLFDKLTQFRTQEVRVAIQSGTRFPNPGFHPQGPDRRPEVTIPTPGTQPMDFMIHAITPNEISDAEALITELPKPIYQEQPSPTGRGTVQTHVGWADDDPEYLRRRRKQIPRRNAAICLFGCTALMESTPGASLEAKADELTDKVPAAILEFLAGEIDTISVITAVGEETVSSFLAEGSAAADTPDSPSSKKPSRQSAKKKS